MVDPCAVFVLNAQCRQGAQGALQADGNSCNTISMTERWSASDPAANFRDGIWE